MEKVLSPEHRAKLFDSSGISQEVADARGYRTVSNRVHMDEYARMEREALTKHFPALEIPIYDAKGEWVGVQLRPDHPRKVDGKVIKYEWPAGDALRLDIHPMLTERIGGTEPLIITEGVLKADAATSRGLCCIGLLGVWGFRGKNDKGGITAFADWQYIHLKGRDVYIAFDSDVMQKKHVRDALRALQQFLTDKRANVMLVYLPAGPNGEKVGLDDYFAAGHSAEDFFALAKLPPPKPSVEPFIEELNAKYALLTQAHYYVEEARDQFGHATFVAHTLPELRNIYANKLIPVETDDGGTKRVNPIEVWNAHPKRREYKFMDLLPGVSQSECDKRGILNMWRGWNVEPKPGSCERILRHIQTRIANGDENIAGKILDLFAYHVQHPLEKIRIAFVMRSKTQGTGKGLLGQYLERIYGPHFVTAETKRAILGQFNAHLAQALVVFVDEATFGGDVQAANQLKTLISEPTRDLEHKGKDIVRVRNLMMMIIAGNAEHLVHVEAGDRRHFVVDVKEERMPSDERGALLAELNSDGPAAFLHFLLSRELPKDYDHQDVPETAARTDAKLHSLPPLERFVYQHLHSGCANVRTDDGDVRQLLWPVLENDYLPQDEWYKAYQQWCRDNGVRFPSDKPLFFRTLSSEGRGIKLSLRRVRPGGRGAQFGASVVPSLEAARALFAEACNLGESAWDGAITIEEQRETIEGLEDACA